MERFNKPISPDIVIFGAGIAGLWIFHDLKRLGYDVLLLEKNLIGGGQSITAQGIIHSGLKFALAGKVSTLAQHISKMPDIWRQCLAGKGTVDLTPVKINAPSQHLLIPAGLIGGVTKQITKKILGHSISEVPQENWPQEITQAGFHGSIIDMNELVLDVPSLIKSLAAPFKNCIKKCTDENPFDFLKRHNITPKKIIFTAAQGNLHIAQEAGHAQGLQTQARPLLQGMMKNAPFPLYAHLIGTSEKPIMTITTHKSSDGAFVWYLGAGVAERAKESPSESVYSAAQSALRKFFPLISLDSALWSCLPVDRIEGKSNTDHWMPDTPSLHRAGGALYCWPTKLTFAPLLAEMIKVELNKDHITPTQNVARYDFLPDVDYALAPWDCATWTK